MTDQQMREQEVRIARYRDLEREVTDPLAAHLLHGIVEELETELQKEREIERKLIPIS
ncbi:hypothetical protein [Bradyrhizobium sp. McL0616]|uniref:hypothetical protein n=1 Tax=Bradyrhizobium sp. McL0616 TaxID=3415674 RepID=UPI003CF6345F